MTLPLDTRFPVELVLSNGMWTPPESYRWNLMSKWPLRTPPDRMVGANTNAHCVK